MDRISREAKMKIVRNAFFTKYPNVGDIQSSPLLHFDFSGCHTSFLSISNADWWRSRADAFILGGGGLFYKNVPSQMRNLVDRRDTYEAGDVLNSPKLILWGAGTNIPSAKRSPEPNDVLSKFDLVGIRDYGVGYRWVPCASCMNPVFDSPEAPQHDVVVYENVGLPIPADPKFPRMNNWNTTIEEVVAFLASGRLVLTSSYHGVYWSQLIGRPVIAFPSSSRFYHMKNKPVFCNDEPWINVKRKAKPVTDFLPECRDVNIAFHKDVVRLIGRIK